MKVDELVGEALGIVARSKRRRADVPADEVDRLYGLLLEAHQAMVAGDADRFVMEMAREMEDAKAQNCTRCEKALTFGDSWTHAETKALYCYGCYNWGNPLPPGDGLGPLGKLKP